MSKRRRGSAFTLVELLMVLAVLGVLMAVLYPQIFAFRRTAEVRECETRIQNLKGVINEYNGEKGDYPPDRLSELDSKYRLASNRQNEGIEALVIALALTGTPAALGFLDDMEAHGGMGNTDQDQAGTVLGRLGHREQREVLDRWGNPLAYFHFRNYNQPQSMTMSSGEIQVVSPVKDPRSGGFMEPRRFQILSAGPDEEFGTDDDIANFELPGRR